MKFRTLPILLTFLLMGVADGMGPLSSAVSQRPVMAALMPFVVFIAFALFSVPAGLLAARIGQKRVLQAGLALNCVALAGPSFLNPPFPLLLACIFLLGAGTTLLQVAGNPILRELGPAPSFSRRLALAQGIKGIGSTSSAYLVTAVTSLACLTAMGWRGAFPIFFGLMLVALVAVSWVPGGAARPQRPPSLASSLALLRRPAIARSVLGIFLYVGAEVCMATFLKPALQGLGRTGTQAAALGPALFFAVFTVGRLLGGSFRLAPRTLFRLSAGLGVVSLALLLSGQPGLALAAVLVGGLGFANIWPMLFALTVELKPDQASEVSGLLCMAISGGALVPLVMGRLGGGASPIAFIIPLLCFLYLLVLALTPAARQEQP